MKISEVISKLTELQKELGDVSVIVFSVDDQEIVTFQKREVEIVERINIGKSDNPRMAVYFD